METPQEMTLNEALQELNRFANVWKAASHLREALQAATGLAQMTQRLETHIEQLKEDENHAQKQAEAAQQKAASKIAEAQARSDLECARFESEIQAREDEYTTLLADKGNEVGSELAKLQDTVDRRRSSVSQALADLNMEIEEKQSLVSELNRQLDTLRQRLG